MIFMISSIRSNTDLLCHHSIMNRCVSGFMPLKRNQRACGVRYRDCVCTQIHNVKDKRSFLITDAIPGEEYLIQVRTKEEYDGLWSNWSTAAHGCSWTGKYVHVCR